MGKKEQEVVDQIKQPIEQQTPLEKQIVDRSKPIHNELKNPTPIKSANTTNVGFNFTSDTLANEEDMSQVRDILTSGEEESEELALQESMYVSVEELARFLELAYDVQGHFTYKELWNRDKSFFYEVAEGILPQINNWVMRIPAVGHAIKTGSAAGSWGKLFLDMGGTWILVYRRKQLEAEQKEKEGAQNNGSTNAATNPPRILVP